MLFGCFYQDALLLARVALRVEYEVGDVETDAAEVDAGFGR